ncbi:MAG: hypothetical protein JSV31_17945 [Desulfobacterales bacterium]|nr:MAG: hypothetical protein JSV31_17945 [Desulfobacterales bacterium]
MTTINKSKVTIINWGLTTIFIVICFLLSLTQSQDAYAEMKKVSGTTKAFVRLAQTHIAVADTPVKGYLGVYNSVLSSANPDWNNARFFLFWYDEPAKEWDDKGYGVITHPAGDQTFIKFVGREISAIEGSEVTAEHEGFFIEGTGKFKDIKARWLWKWKSTHSEGRMAEWKVEYF